jgi:hypothetical protein
MTAVFSVRLVLLLLLLLLPLAFAAGCSGPSGAIEEKPAGGTKIVSAGPAVAVDEAQLAAARSVGPRASAVLIETERTRKYLKSHRLFEVSNKTDEGVQQWKRVVVAGDGRVLQGHQMFSIPSLEKVAIGDERTAREIGALLTDLVQPGNAVFEVTADRLEREKRFDVVVVAMTGGPRYGHSETYRWTFSLTGASEVLIQYRSPVVLPKGG